MDVDKRRYVKYNKIILFMNSRFYGGVQLIKYMSLLNTSALRLLGRFAAEHNHTPTAKRLVCGLYTSNIDYKA